MNRKVLLFCALTLPVFFLVNVYQSYRYEEFRRDILAKEKQQKIWIEKNKQMSTGVTIMSSPARIEKLARDLNLEQPQSKQVLKVQFAPKKDSDG